jgi:hypothetical protein
LGPKRKKNLQEPCWIQNKREHCWVQTQIYWSFVGLKKKLHDASSNLLESYRTQIR